MVLSGWDLRAAAFDKAYGGEGDIGGSITSFEMLASATCR